MTASTVTPEHRGTTSIPSSAVARIAAQAASEVPHVGSDAGGVLGMGARRDFDSRPGASCELYGRSAVLHLDVGAEFPAPLPPILRALREHVQQRVEQLTGLEVGRLDVKISWLHPATNGRRAVR
ncbi:Asp23/Gls24 family envelope stress response protein [Brachybacterium sp. NBEC-018]|uniref:Asp23/Gls24 family envelope stress response protein n=1 Tax=Brachybacterium sp. NBEC-018 TaxID=2996004 RepID=UPI002175438A|nr:Asp23/Gls24 family envelope stress response protein [Brachybacterium sp. NBEC-018]UVY85096.1 Asp23/Gls24 family envelope stress response protein [Brachybacterium sp. NBEC-018]